VKVRGTYTLDAPRREVFAAICDPGILMAVIPGCEGIEQVGPAEYRGTIALRLPGFGGRYRTTVALVDAVPPERAGMEGSVDGPFGSIHGRADFVLADRAGATTIEYSGEATIEGPLARLDSRFAESLAGSLISQGLRTLNQRLVRQPSEVAARSERHAPTEVSQ
jgi:carbon monoxide dehydrogenase subunit G